MARAIEQSSPDPRPTYFKFVTSPFLLWLLVAGLAHRYGTAYTQQGTGVLVYLWDSSKA